MKAAAPTTIARLLAALFLLLLLPIPAGCASVALSATRDQVPSVHIDPDAAGAIALNALEAWNAGDYSRWSRDWSQTLKAEVRAGDFDVFRDGYFQRYGPCFAITASAPSTSTRTGYTRWSFDVKCRSGLLRFTFAFADSNTEVQSIYVDPQ